MIAIVPKPSPAAADLKRLRRYCTLSLSAIRQAAAERRPIRAFEAFAGAWHQERTLLAEIARAYASDERVPYEIVEVEEGGEEAVLSTEALRGHLRYLREIELETQRQADLETGAIADEAAFEPHDEDWAAGLL